MKKKILIPLIAGVLVIIGVVIFVILKSGNTSYFNIKIMDTSGTVTIDRDGSSLDAYEGLKIRDKDYLRVGHDGFTRIDCDRSTYSHFEHDTEASFIADSEKKLTIKMIKGEMVVELQKEFSNDEKLSVKTPNTTMAIRGTVVAVKVIPNADGGVRTINYCLEGKADIEIADGSTETIKAGEGRLVVTDADDNVTENRAVGAEEFEFKDIDIDSLKGADEDAKMVVNIDNSNNADGGGAGRNDSEGSDINGYIPPDTIYDEVLIDGTNFPDTIFRLYVIDKIDVDDNGILNFAELGEVSIDVVSSGIKDLKGIEFFKNLLNLNCIGNELTSLDLSQNTKLESLYCSKNHLKSLNIDNCTELSHLDCQENEIETLDISKCTNLRYINCESNNLEALDVSNAYDLMTLVCGKNSILDVDVSKNKDLLYLDCHLNPLTTLDVSNNPRLGYLYCYDDQLKKIDVSSNKNLECLYAGSNQLTSIDVSNNIALRELSCYNCFISKIDVSNNPNLEILMCGSSTNDLTSLDVSHNPELIQLEFPFTKIAEIDLSNNPKLEKLNCMYTELTTLDLSHNPLIKDTNLYYDAGKVKIIR